MKKGELYFFAAFAYFTMSRLQESVPHPMKHLLHYFYNFSELVLFKTLSDTEQLNPSLTTGMGQGCAVVSYPWGGKPGKLTICGYDGNLGFC